MYKYHIIEQNNHTPRCSQKVSAAGLPWLEHLNKYTVNRDVKHQCLFSNLAARMGAYFHGVLINACNFLVARNVNCVGTD